MDEKTIKLLPDSIYSHIYSVLADRQGSARGMKAGFAWADSPHPVWGRACYDLDLRENAEAVLSELAVTSRSLGARILTGPASTPEGVEAALASAGFVRTIDSAGMIVDRDGFRPRSLPAGFAIGEVAAAADWRRWSSIVCRNLFHKEEAQDADAFAAAGVALASGPGFRAFLGCDSEGRAIAASAALDCPKTGGVFFVAVEKAERGRGYGAAITSRATAACFESGFEYATLSATEDGKPVYEGLGYRTVSTIGRYAPPPT